MLEVNRFDDLILIYIFEQLNLNERAKLRLMNRRFRNIIDSLYIQNLVIFDRMPIVKSKYKFTNTQWRLEDTVYVLDFSKFIKRFAKKLENLKSLVIIGVNQGVQRFEINQFKQLTHLELSNVSFKDAQILKSSSKLNNYFHYDSKFDDCIVLNTKRLEHLSIPGDLIDILWHNSNSLKEIDCLQLQRSIFLMNFDYSIPSNLIIKKLRISTNLDLAINFCDKLQTIKELELILVGLGPYDVQNDLNKLESFLNAKRSDLSVYIWGCKLETKADLKEFNEFFPPLANKLYLEFKRIHLLVDQCDEIGHLHFHHFKHDSILVRFHQLIDIIIFEKHVHQNDRFYLVFKEMKNVKELILNLEDRNHHLEFKGFFNLFPFINRLEITQKPETGINNQVFDLIPSNCENIYHFKMHCFEEDTNLDFILKMKNLKYLIILLYHPIENETIIKLIQTLPYLSFLKIYSHQPEEFLNKPKLSKLIFFFFNRNEQCLHLIIALCLGAFKEQVKSMVTTKLKYADFEFSITVQRKQLKKQDQKCAVLRYTFERKKHLEKAFKNNSNDDLNKIWQMIECKGLLRPRQIVFNDEIVSKILSYLSLNERTNCRLVFTSI